MNLEVKLNLNSVSAEVWRKELKDMIETHTVTDFGECLLLQVANAISSEADKQEHNTIDNERMREKAYIEQIALTERGIA